jgi:hypothetical protein
VDDIKKEYCVLFVIAEILKGHSVEVTDDPQHRDAIAQVRRLLPNHMVCISQLLKPIWNVYHIRMHI